MPQSQTATVMMRHAVPTQARQVSSWAQTQVTESAPVLGSASTDANKVKITEEKLDGQTFNGVYAEGTRRTITHPGASMGTNP